MSACLERTLRNGEILSLSRGRGHEITVLAGRLWITEEACNDDVWLEAGQHANLSGDGLAVIESVGASRVEIH